MALMKAAVFVEPGRIVLEGKVAPQVVAAHRFADIDRIAGRLADRRLGDGQREFTPQDRPTANAPLPTAAIQ